MVERKVRRTFKGRRWRRSAGVRCIIDICLQAAAFNIPAVSRSTLRRQSFSPGWLCPRFCLVVALALSVSSSFVPVIPPGQTPGGQLLFYGGRHLQEERHHRDLRDGQSHR